MLLNHLMRYTLVADLLGKWRTNQSAFKILEVGCGSQGLALHMPGLGFVGCDLTFPEPPAATMSPVICSASRLPFANNAFDIVLSLDMLEHIQPSARLGVLREFGRVAGRKIIIGFPQGYAAQCVDWCLKKFYVWRNIQRPPWLDEHLQAPFPARSDLITAFPEWHLQEYNSENVWLHLMLMILETRPAFNKWFVRWFTRRSEYIRRAIVRVISFWPYYRKVFVVSR